jgi:UDP-N-acetyl-D-glucosamine dehydrogenase
MRNGPLPTPLRPAPAGPAMASPGPGDSGHPAGFEDPTARPRSRLEEAIAPFAPVSLRDEGLAPFLPAPRPFAPRLVAPRPAPRLRAERAGPTAPKARPTPEAAALLARRISDRTARVAVVGLGHVGLPLAQAASAAGFATIGLDTDAAKVAELEAGRSPLRHLPAGPMRPLLESGRFRPTTDSGALREADVILICVPTPLDADRQPDLSHVIAAAGAVAASLRPGQLVVLESTTWPGTTRRVLLPILEEGGLRCGRDVFLAYSPEREDPGNATHRTETIPKLVAGADPPSLRLALALYGAIVRQVVPVASPETAEAAKLVENVFRAVNIALANEMKLCLGAMGLDAWEVIAAAATKPFGFMPFWPGPGPGGHCIPVDPIYLAWAARAHGAPARLVEAAMTVNAAAPGHVVRRLEEALRLQRGDAAPGTGLAGARVLVLGVGYKRNIGDVRDSPGLALLEMLEREGAALAAYHDPLVPCIPAMPEHPRLAGRRGLTPAEALAGPWDAVLIATDHDGVDYAAILAAAPLVVDTRNLCARLGLAGPHILKA